MSEFDVELSERVLGLTAPVNGTAWQVALFRDTVEANPDSPDDLGPATMAWPAGVGIWTLFDEHMVGSLNDEALDHLWGNAGARVGNLQTNAVRPCGGGNSQGTA